MDTTSTIGTGKLSWADSAACTLPTSERPLRLAEFDELFATALRSLVRTGSTSVRMELSGDAELAEQTGQLAERESACCSFFTFNVGPLDAGRVAFDVQVPVSYVDVLNGLVTRADGILGRAS